MPVVLRNQTFAPETSVSTGAHRSLFAALRRAFSTGLAASADYRRAEAMTDRQLAKRGTAREELPKYLHDRHYS